MWIIYLIREFWKILEYLLKEIEILFKNITFLVFLTSFFFLFYLFMVFKKNLKFLCCSIGWIRDFIKKFCKTIVFFFKQKIEIFEIQNFNKIPSFSISFLLFLHFWHFFSISPIQTCPKIVEFFVVFYWKG